jgi:LPXTG-motif cell wall-anchored protein
MASDESRPVDETDEPTPQATDTADDATGEESPWGTLVFGLVLIAGAGWIYWYFGKLETEGGEVRMPAIAWAIYEWLGRVGLAGVVGLLGAFMTVGGLVGLRSRSE